MIFPIEDLKKQDTPCYYYDLQLLRRTLTSYHVTDCHEAMKQTQDTQTQTMIQEEYGKQAICR